MDNDWAEARSFLTWKKNVLSNWSKVKFNKIETVQTDDDVQIRSSYKLTAELNLGNLTPKDVDVQIYFGKLDDQTEAFANSYVQMECINKTTKTGKFKYEGQIACDETGQFGYTLRILPNHSLLTNKFELGLIKWA